MTAGLASLRTRIFVASTLLATASIGAAVYFVSVRLSSQAEADLQRDLVEAAGLVDQQSASLFDSFTRTATLIADLPKFKAALETRDRPTIEPIARDYLLQAGADVLVVADRDGARLAAVTAPSRPASLPYPATSGRAAVTGPSTAFWPHPSGVLQVVSVPVTIDLERPELLGTLTMGYLLDAERAATLKALTGADVAFAYDGTVRASSMSDASGPAIAPWIHQDQHVRSLELPDGDYSALVRPLAGAGEALGGIGEPPRAVVLRSRTAQMRTLGAIRAALAGIALATVGLAAVLSYAIARTVTRPLATITAHMREVAATGDLTRKVSLPASGWSDEDATVMAATFNALTESLAASQRGAAQRERLSALGRLSTVIAHEIRNPLMIIKGALRPLLRADGTAADRRDAAHDINGEVDRLNRVVNEVLDFARPIRFDLASADPNDICRSARDAVVAAAATPDVVLELDPACPSIVTDAERVRTVLVNLLTNARAAVVDAPAGAAPLVALSSEPAPHGGVALVVRDRGVGISADDLGRIFDPYFTTRRTGSGLGLAIAKNVVDGLGGTITATATVGAGTEMRVVLPAAAPRDRRS
ncbi:MAG: ATP-binding protein [Vicinamibacterales bacterium]